jgi:hypothetical protein
VSLVAVVVIALGAYLWWPSEERAVKNRLRRLAETLSVPAQSNDVGRVTRLAQLRRYFADNVEVRSGGSEPQTIPLDALLAAIASWTPPPGGLTIEFVDEQVTIQPDAAGAKVYLTVKISAHDARTGEPTVDAREAHLGMVKRNGAWIVASVETADTLERPPS